MVKCLIVEVKELVKCYRDIKAVDRVSFAIQENEIFAMIGLNGAGKTTTIECIEGLKKPDSGSIEVLGLDPRRDRKRLYELIGVQLQEASYPDRLKVWEICKLFSTFYKDVLPYEELLEKFELYKKRNAYISKLSGGQRQKLSIILALISKPKIIFLDELTTGLDPQARRTMWGLIKGLQKEGMTVFLTTHYMEEAEYLCDRVAIINYGKIIALDTVRNLINSSGIEEVVIFKARQVNLEALRKVEGVDTVKVSGNEFIVSGKGKNLLINVVSFLQKEANDYSDLKIKKANLEDVFLKLTGHPINETLGGN